MLKKFLEDMFVPEEILNNISEDDRQLIFIEIRKEQIRRYNAWQSSDKYSEEFHHKPNRRGRNIKFIEDSELVSVLGERPYDRPIEDILKEEKLIKAQKEAERVILEEIGAIPDKGTVINEYPELGTQIIEATTNLSIDAIIAPQAVNKSPPERPPKPIAKRAIKTSEQKLEEMMKRKSTEIYQTLLSQQNDLEETAIKENEQLEPIWEKAAEQARLDDEQRRKKAIEARKFYENINKEIKNEVVVAEDINDSIVRNQSSAPPPPAQKSSQLRYVLSAISNFEILSKTAKSKSDIKAWFLENEWNKRRIVDNATNKVPDWFHGMITRPQSEKLLSNMDVGSFLIRVSEKCFCYVLSYKSKSKVKHILIQSKTEFPQYEFVGPPNTTVFKSLQDLISNFQTHFLSDSNRDILTTACGQVEDAVVDYIHLIQPDCSQCDKKSIHKCQL